MRLNLLRLNKDGGSNDAMKNPLIVVVVIAILFIVGVSIFTLSQKPRPDSDSQIETDEMIMDDGTIMDKDEHQTMMSDQNRYVVYSKKTLAKASDKRRVLYFYANWCPICRPADANFKENVGRIPQDLVLIRVNYNDSDTDQEEKDLAQKYGITYQHTFVQIDAKGNKISVWNGGQINELLNNIK